MIESLFPVALIVNLVLIPALGWGLGEALARRPRLDRSGPGGRVSGGPFGAKLAELQ